MTKVGSGLGSLWGQGRGSGANNRRATGCGRLGAVIQLVESEVDPIGPKGHSGYTCEGGAGEELEAGIQSLNLWRGKQWAVKIACFKERGVCCHL